MKILGRLLLLAAILVLVWFAIPEHWRTSVTNIFNGSAQVQAADIPSVTLP